jgi:hypothetical protein
MSLMRAVSRARLGGLQEQCSGSLRALFSAQAAPADKGTFYDVPEGHQSSDLSDVACNIGLSRRKDLTLRQDIRLTVDGQPAPLAALLKVIHAPLDVLWTYCRRRSGARHQSPPRSPSHPTRRRRRRTGAAPSRPLPDHRERRRSYSECPTVARSAASSTCPGSCASGTRCARRA